MVPLLVCLLCAIPLYHLCRAILQRRSFRRTAKSLGCELPIEYPHLDPIWGIDLLIQIWREFHHGELSEGMRRRHEQFGDTFSTRNLGQDCIYTSDPENIHSITTGDFESYVKSAWVKEGSKHVGYGVLLNDGEAWRRSRIIVKPIFAGTALDVPKLVEPHMDQLVTAIRESNGKPFDFRERASQLSLGIVTDFLFGISAKALSGAKDGDEARHFLSLIKQFEPPAATFIAVGPLAWLELWPQYRNVVRVVDGMKAYFMRQLHVVYESSTHSAGPSCFRMMKDQGIPSDKILGELRNIFFASFDTSAALLANILHVLARRKDIQHHLRDEISYLKGSPPTKGDLSGMCYLRHVFLEALRLYTPVVSHSREASKDTLLPKGGGVAGQSPIFVHKGATIIYSIYSLNRDPRHYGKDWAEFKPERWEKLKRGSCDFYMPFGSGPRACMGQQMAQTEITYIIVRLLQEFSVIENEDPRPFKEAKAVSFYNGSGVRVSMV